MIFLYVGLAAVELLIVGLVLIKIAAMENEKRDIQWFMFIDKTLLPETKEAVMDVVEKELDMIPEKLKEARRKMEEET